MKENPRYICFYCGGKGEIEPEGPTWKSVESCRHCHGSGKARIKVRLEEYESLRRAFELACEAIDTLCPGELEDDKGICKRFDCDSNTTNCWQEYFLTKARKEK